MNSGTIDYPADLRGGFARRWPGALRVSLVLAAAFWFAGCDARVSDTQAAATDNDVIPYQYERTRQLVQLVDSAAELVTKEGEKAFPQFDQRGSRWFHDGIYLFVFNAQGICVFHAMTSSMIGQDFINLKDFYGKPALKRMVALTHKSGPAPSGWFFYLWQDGTQFNPVWKSAYVRAVVTPSGEHWIIGSGLYNIRIEREFLRLRVDKAVRLLQQKGRAEAFREFQALSSPFVFLGTYVFVLDMQGNAMVDPAFPTHSGRSLVEFKDAVGKPVVKNILDKMHGRDRAWVQYKWPRPGMHKLGRKVVYARKVETPEGPVIVGADVFLATPIWMGG